VELAEMQAEAVRAAAHLGLLAVAGLVEVRVLVLVVLAERCRLPILYLHN
jgi:hypothetical protein